MFNEKNDLQMLKDVATLEKISIESTNKTLKTASEEDNKNTKLIMSPYHDLKRTRFLFPCIALSINALLHHYKVSCHGKNVVILGNSYLVGYPSFMLFQIKNATVTVCTEHTFDIKHFTRNADIIVSATGVSRLITGDMIKKDSVIIDVGVNVNNNGKILGGDVDFDSCIDKVKLITPVPGGLGPLTVVYMINNLWNAYRVSSSVF